MDRPLEPVELETLDTMIDSPWAIRITDQCTGPPNPAIELVLLERPGGCETIENAVEVSALVRRA